MTLEQFIEFMDDSGILQTHTPRDDNDEPMERYEMMLDPAELMTTIPRDLGLEAGKEIDYLSINFFQFYQMLVRIAEIVYEEIYQKDETLAMNKLLLVINSVKMIRYDDDNVIYDV